MKSPILAALLLGTALASAPALAAGDKPAADKAAATQAKAGPVKYITKNTRDTWRATRIEGVEVYNGQNEKIGDIDDVLIDRDGKVEAVVIGVGGFLGLGERNVAVPYDALKWHMNADAGTASQTRKVVAGKEEPMPNRGAQGEPARTGMPERATGTDRATTTADAPGRAILPGATKEQLAQAPEFKYAE
ncbi:MAG: PRC-barrel domain-containing protein [Alphaproteobacteria bacterium]